MSVKVKQNSTFFRGMFSLLHTSARGCFGAIGFKKRAIDSIPEGAYVGPLSTVNTVLSTLLIMATFQFFYSTAVFSHGISECKSLQRKVKWV